MFERELKLIQTLSSYRIDIGVISDTSSRDNDNISVGITNAQLMFIHENGSPTRNIPARPVLQMTIDYANNSGLLVKVLDKIINNILNDNTYNETKIEIELKRFCSKLEEYARDIIYNNDGRLAPNSPNVAKRKKGNHPLFDTGQLARSIVCRLSKNS